MEKIEKKARAQVRQIIEKLDDDHREAERMKRDNVKLRKKIQALMKNNQNMAAILRKLDNKMEETHVLPKRDYKNYRYSYQEGMMIKREEVSRKRLELKKKNADLTEVNRQLNEILEIMKKRNINIDTDENNKEQAE
jgi:hypothetical protein